MSTPLDSQEELRQAHAYLHRRPEAQISAVRGLLETTLDPVARALANAPAEDEEVSEHERLATEGWERMGSELAPGEAPIQAKSMDRDGLLDIHQTLRRPL